MLFVYGLVRAVAYLVNFESDGHLTVWSERGQQSAVETFFGTASVLNSDEERVKQMFESALQDRDGEIPFDRHINEYEVARNVEEDDVERLVDKISDCETMYLGDTYTFNLQDKVEYRGDLQREVASLVEEGKDPFKHLFGEEFDINENSLAFDDENTGLFDIESSQWAELSEMRLDALDDTTEEYFQNFTSTHGDRLVRSWCTWYYAVTKDEEGFVPPKNVEMFQDRVGNVNSREWSFPPNTSRKKAVQLVDEIRELRHLLKHKSKETFRLRDIAGLLWQQINEDLRKAAKENAFNIKAEIQRNEDAFSKDYDVTSYQYWVYGFGFLYYLSPRVKGYRPDIRLGLFYKMFDHTNVDRPKRREIKKVVDAHGDMMRADAYEQKLRFYREDSGVAEDNLTGIQFESLVAEVYRKEGHTVKETQSTGDQGADLLLLDDESVAVQVKHYDGSVGNKAVQEALGGKEYYSTDKAAVVISSSYTDSAKELAQSSDVGLYVLQHTANGKELTRAM